MPGPQLRVLVTDGSSLTARQAVTALAARGAIVEMVDPGLIPLGLFTRFVRKSHRVPAYGSDPWGWLDATIRVLERGGHDALFAAHEQTAVLSLAADRVRATGAGLAVPSFGSLWRVQDKAHAIGTLAAAGLRHPATTVAETQAEAASAGVDAPLYVKTRIGTASAGVARVEDAAGLVAATARFAGEGAFESGGVLLQEAVPGELAMIQAAFDQGELVAHHANLRLREGADGGASHKRSVAIPELRDDLARLGRELAWHGALSLDAVLTPAGPSYIDVNPRLVEPANAQRSGVDLVGSLLDLSLGRRVAPSDPGRPGVLTHQLLLAILGEAQRGGGRRGVAAELVQAARGRGTYAGSREELTPLAGDALAAVPVTAVAASLMAYPGAYSWFTSGAVANYSLTAGAWRQIVAGAE
jgi:biotin carboxylase